MDIDALRAQTPGCAGRIHLNNAGAALLAQPTLDAMTAQLRREAEIGGHEAEAVARDAIAATYDAIARLIGTGPGRSQRLDHRAGGQSARHRRPGRPPAHPVFRATTTTRLSRSSARLTWRSADAESDRPVAAMPVAGGDGPA